MYISKLPGLHSSQTLDIDWQHALLFVIFMKYQSTIDPVISLIFIGFLSSFSGHSISSTAHECNSTRIIFFKMSFLGLGPEKRMIPIGMHLITQSFLQNLEKSKKLFNFSRIFHLNIYVWHFVRMLNLMFSHDFMQWFDSLTQCFFLIVWITWGQLKQLMCQSILFQSFRIFSMQSTVVNWCNIKQTKFSSYWFY